MSPMGFTGNIRKSSSIFLLICFSFSSFQTTKACHETDQAALLDFKSKIIDDGPYKRLGTWSKDGDCCTHWDGVACDHSNGRVIHVIRPGLFSRPDGVLDIGYMIGTISPSLGNLKFLQILNLNHLKKLNGSIPSELGNKLKADR
ncbi:hypothetical protein C5167_047627 [Papaver somniferum]|uniref:Leucine-rich repeat-containing N-terminal plant-type domain-containing protein n=1 Tax=Papaver somniferum TaxID=3469 RepID=A0A4Y7LL70_PAPSO|nr:DNA damage-repair/toleration protein DRT100-like isoform X1 [Papaver somniferum]RZC84845.1 hypothetical protein C5167_047627 [Papaver somniferum]